MNKFILTGVLALAIPCGASADSKHWYKDPKWWLGEGITLSAIALDYHSTSVAEAHGFTETHTFLLGSHPAGHRLALAGASEAVGFTALHIALHKLLHGGFSNAIVPAITSPHFVGAVHNYEVAK